MALLNQKAEALLYGHRKGKGKASIPTRWPTCGEAEVKGGVVLGPLKGDPPLR